jgi:secondary thiamine-phosphate synthase enzyme
MQRIDLSTRSREELLDVGGEVRDLLQREGWQDGAVLLFCPHTTAALTVNEGADPDVARDMVVNLRGLIPRRGDYRHVEGNSDAHIKTSLVGPSLLLIVENGRPCLGTWQKVFFCEFDGPRQRQVWVQWLPGADR